MYLVRKGVILKMEGEYFVSEGVTVQDIKNKCDFTEEIQLDNFFFIL